MVILGHLGVFGAILVQNMPEIQTDRNDLGTRIEKDHGDDYDDQVILHNQEAFEDHVDNLEQGLESGDNQGSHNRESKDAKEIDRNLIPLATPEISKWERSDGDDTIKDDNNSQEDRDLRELLKAKSSLSNLTPALKSTISLNDSVADKEQEPDYDKLIQEKLKDHERIDVTVGSEDDEMAESSDEMKNKYLSGGYGYGHAKNELLELILDKYKNQRKMYFDLIKNEDYLNNVLKLGEKKAKVIANNVLSRVKKKLGY